MKILHIIDSLSLGGAETLIRSMLPMMKDDSLAPEVLTLKINPDHSDRDLLNKGIKVHNTGLSSVYSVWQIIVIARFLKKNQYDLIHVHLFPAQYWVVFAKLLAGIKCLAITTEHNTYNKRRNYKAFRVLERYIYSAYEKIICISDSAKEALIKWQPLLADKTVTIYNGIDLNKYYQAKAYSRQDICSEIKPGCKLILMVASLTTQKDHLTLLKALSVLPDDYSLLLVGDGPLKHQLIERVSEMGLSDRVFFMGYRNDVERIMKTADILVQSSHWEGFGLVVVEAMASGLPVIASDVAGMREVINNADLLFEPGDYLQLAEKIKRILSTETHYEDTRDRCLKQAKSFALERMVSSYEEVYKTVLSVKGKSAKLK